MTHEGESEGRRQPLIARATVTSEISDHVRPTRGTSPSLGSIQVRSAVKYPIAARAVSVPASPPTRSARLAPSRPRVAMPDDRALKSWVGDQLHALLGFAEGNLAAYVVGLGASAPVARHPSCVPTRRPPPVARPMMRSSSRSKPPPLARLTPDPPPRRHRPRPRLHTPLRQEGARPGRFGARARVPGPPRRRRDARVRLGSHLARPWLGRVRGSRSRRQRRQARRARGRRGRRAERLVRHDRLRRRRRRRRWRRGGGPGSLWAAREESSSRPVRRLRLGRRRGAQSPRERRGPRGEGGVRGASEGERREQDEAPGRRRTRPRRFFRCEEAARPPPKPPRRASDDLGSGRTSAKSRARRVLKERAVICLDELKDSIEDEKYLFEGTELTAAEKRDIEYRRKVYELATQQIRDIDAVMEDRYRLPASYDEAGAEGRDARSRRPRRGTSPTRTRI